uniref:tRNA pseudouridine synthase n=1 Tax=Setaria digitata TaxID=48799 RepID=A0A915PMR5_9BILA
MHEVSDDDILVNNKKVKERTHGFDFSRYPRRRIALMFMYFGWEYNGLVRQQEITETVEEEMKKALMKTKLIESWENCGWNRSGRTDKGVSAFRQIASLIVRSNELGGDNVFWPSNANCSSETIMKKELQYVKMLNGTLPNNIRVLAWAPVPGDFSSRYSCTQRTYTYAFPRANFDAMRKACQFLIGEHDFRNFCRIDMNKARVEMSYVRTITYADISFVIKNSLSSLKLDDGTANYEFLKLTIKGSGFLWHQIRCIMALLCEIGHGNEEPEIITELLDINLTPSKPVYGLAPAFPLCLFDCVYDGVELAWRWDTDSLKSIRKLILKTWTHYQSLSATLQIMAEGIGMLEPVLQTDFSGLNEYLKPSGNSTKTYVPIKKRPTCDPLELKQEKIRAKISKIVNGTSINSGIIRTDNNY